MFNVGGGEVLVILVLALVVLGPDKLPTAAKTVGKHLADFRRISNGFRQEITNAMDLGSFTDPAPSAPAPAATTATTATPVPGAVPGSTPTPPTATVADDRSSVPTWVDGPVDSFV